MRESKVNFFPRMKDLRRQGRGWKGKLTAERVLVIKKRLKNGDEPKEIANDEGITTQYVHDIGRGKAWATVNLDQ